MKKFEKQLRQIQQSTDLFITDVSLGIPEKDLDYLRAIGLISLGPAGDNILHVTLTDEGIAYFYKKRQRIIDFFSNRIVDFILGLISGILLNLLFKK